MKHLIFALPLILCSCEDVHVEKKPDRFINGHAYLYVDLYCLVHDPDCAKCMEQRDKRTLLKTTK